MWTILLSIRYFLAKRKEGIISFINFASVIGVAIGVAALIIVLSVMNGFDTEVREKIIGTYAHLMIFADKGIEHPEELSKRVSAIPEVKSTASFVTGQAVLRKDDAVMGVLLKGIDVRAESEVTDVLSFVDGKAGGLNDRTIVLGSELMDANGITAGDTVELVVPRSMLDLKKKTFTVVGSFTSGRYDYDANIAVVNLTSAQELYGMEGKTSGLAIRLKDEGGIIGMKKRLQSMMGYPYIVKSWMDLDKNLVSALALEKKMMAIVLGIIVIVACFNITSSLIMTVMEKTRDIGILKAIGATSAGVSSVFLTMGFVIGALGTALGAVAGVFIAGRVNVILSFFERITGCKMFPRDVYYFSEVPVRINSHDVFMIIGFAIVLALVSGIYPAWKASRLDPVEAIRYE